MKNEFRSRQQSLSNDGALWNAYVCPMPIRELIFLQLHISTKKIVNSIQLIICVAWICQHDGGLFSFSFAFSNLRETTQEVEQQSISPLVEKVYFLAIFAVRKKVKQYKAFGLWNAMLLSALQLPTPHTPNSRQNDTVAINFA